MSRSTDSGHFFQTSASISESSRKAAKSKNTAGKPIRLPSKILAVAADPDDDRRVYVAEAAGTARRVVLEVCETSHVFSGPTAPLTCLALSQSMPRTLFTGCWDKSIWSWSADTRTQKRRYNGHADFVKALFCLRTNNKDLLISGSADATVVVWDVESGQKLHTLKGHTRGILALAIDPLSLPEPGSNLQEGAEESAVTVFSADSSREIRRWTISSSSASEVAEDAAAGPTPILAHETSVYALHFDADGDLWTASADKTAKCLIREQGWKEDTSLAHPDFVRDVLVDEEGGWVVTACRDEEVRVWERGSGKLHHTLSGHFEEVTGLVLLGKTLVSVSIDATIRQWSLAPEDLRQAKLDAEKAKEGKEEEEKPKDSMLTEDEERELAELMDEDD